MFDKMAGDPDLAPPRRCGHGLTAGLLALTLWASACSSLVPPGARETTATTTAPTAGQASAAKPLAVWSSSMEAKRVALEKASLDTGIAVLRTPDNQLQVNVPSDFSFDPDSATLKPAMRPVLASFADDLALPALSHLRVRVVGHTDDRGSDAANDALSLARARSVARYLEAVGITVDRISVEGHGEHEPSASNEQRYGRALNRRIEMFLTEPAGPARN